MQGGGGQEQVGAALRELGRELEARRSETGRTLADAEAALKIRQYYLAALEAGDAGAFPGLVYQLGFLRAYGDFLGLSGEQLVMRCRAAMQPTPVQAQAERAAQPVPAKIAEPVRPAPVPPVPQPPVSSIRIQAAVDNDRESRFAPAVKPSERVVERRRRPAAGAGSASRGALRLVLLVIMIFAVVALVYTVARAPGPQDPQSGNTPPPVITPPVIPPSGEQPPVTAPFGRDSITKLSETPQELRFEVAADSLQLKVSLLDLVWIRVVTDGVERVADIKAPGADLVFTANEQMSLRTGRASKTGLSVFGVDLGPAGPEDDARTVVFARKK